MKPTARMSLGTCGGTLFLTLGLLLLAAKMAAQESPKPIWTISLEAYGYKHFLGLGKRFTSVDGLATTRDTIAVALGIHDYRNGRRSSFLHLILFDAKTGKFLSKLGPWESDPPYHLTSTQGGRFLLFLSEGELHLFSSQGQELKEVDVDIPPTTPGHWWRTSSFVSPSKRTFLLLSTEFESRQGRFRVYSADTCELKMEWTEEMGKDDGAPYVTGVSDEGMLGSAGGYRNHFVRDFRGAWRPFPLPAKEASHDKRWSLWQDKLAFLDDARVVSGPYQSNAEVLFSVVQTDGKPISTYTIPRLPDYNYVAGVSAVSQDGRCFAAKLRHENKLSHWWDSTMDMWPAGADYYVYAWIVGTRTPIRRVATHGSASASFFPDSSGLVIADEDQIKLFPLPDTADN